MEDPKNIKEELTEEELKGVDGGAQTIRNPNEELSDEELKGVTGGVGYEFAQVPPMSGITVHEGIDESNTSPFT